MALPIKSTPTLYGEDARKFLEAIANPKKASPEEIARMKAHYEDFKKIMEKSKENFE